MFKLNLSIRNRILSESVVIVILVLLPFSSCKISAESSFVSLDVDTVEMWSVQIGDTYWGPSILDLDRDGELEIIISDQKRINCITQTGEIKWKYYHDEYLRGELSFGDMNADGKLDVICNSRDGTICVNHNGKLLWDTGYLRTSHSKPLVYDINGDGFLEVLINSHYNNPYILDHKGNLVGEIPINFNTSWMFLFSNADPAVVDLDSDGILEYLFLTEEQTLHCLDSSFNEVWQYTCGIGMVAPCFADFEGDGFIEIIMGSSHGRFFCLNYDGTLKWLYWSDGLNYYDPAIGDIDNDGDIEIVMSCDDYFFCLNETGGEEWIVDPPLRDVGFPTLCDLESDGFFETIVTGDKGIYVIDYNGSVIDIISPSLEFNGWLSIADINSDNSLEILAVTENKVVCIELTNSNSSTSWYTENGSIYRTGHVDSDSDYIDDFSEEYRFLTNKTNPDTDSDSLPDNWEIEYGLNPLIDDSLLDLDKDGFDNLKEYSKALNPSRWDNWVKLYAGYLMPVWIFLSSLLVFFYVKTKPWKPRIVKFSKARYVSFKEWLVKTAPLKEEIDLDEMRKEHQLKQEKV